MKFKNRIITLILIFTLIMTFTACDSNEVNESTETTKEEMIELKFIGTESRDNYDSDARVKAYFDAIELFEKDYPNVKITHESIPHDAYQQKVQVLSAANELPDLFDVKGSWNKNMVNNGLVASLTPYLNDNKAWADTIKPNTNINFTIEDEVYGLSVESGGSTSLVFYNEAIFKECGIDEFPATAEAFYEAIDKINAKGYTPISMGNKGKWLAESCYLSTIGNRFTGTEWTRSIIDNKGAKFTDQAFIDALAYFQSLADKGAFNSDLNSIDYKQQRVPYYNGQAAMFVEGFWAISAVINDAPEEISSNTKIAILPDVDNGLNNASMISGGAGGWAKSMNAGLSDEKKELIANWFEYYISEENATLLYNEGIIPGMESTSYDEEKLHRLQLDYYEIMDNIVPCEVYDLTFNPAVEAVLESGLQELLIGIISPEELAERIQEEYEKVSVEE